MSPDFLYFESTPVDEPCLQVGSPQYSGEAARAECLRTIALIRKLFGAEPFGARLRVGTNPHDFGTYYDIRCHYSDDESRQYAFAIDADFPTTWDDERVRAWREPVSCGGV